MRSRRPRLRVERAEAPWLYLSPEMRVSNAQPDVRSPRVVTMSSAPRFLGRARDRRPCGASAANQRRDDPVTWKSRQKEYRSEPIATHLPDTQSVTSSPPLPRPRYGNSSPIQRMPHAPGARTAAAHKAADAKFASWKRPSGLSQAKRQRDCGAERPEEAADEHTGHTPSLEEGSSAR